MHQYIKILTVCLSVCVQRKWDVCGAWDVVGRGDVCGAGLDYSDVRPSYFEPQTPRRMFENSGHGRNLPEQLALSSSRSRRNWGAAVEVDQSGSSRRRGCHRGAELKRTQSGSSS